MIEAIKTAIILAPLWVVLIICGIVEGWVVAASITALIALTGLWVVAAIKILE